MVCWEKSKLRITPSINMKKKNSNCLLDSKTSNHYFKTNTVRPCYWLNLYVSPWHAMFKNVHNISHKKKKEKKNQFILIAMVPKVILSKQITLTSSLMTFQYKFQKHQCLAKNSNLLIFVFWRGVYPIK